MSTETSNNTMLAILLPKTENVQDSGSKTVLTGSPRAKIYPTIPENYIQVSKGGNSDVMSAWGG